MYSKIINPETGRSVLINGQLGKNILRTYLKVLEGGSGEGRSALNQTATLVDQIIHNYKDTISKAIAQAELNFDKLVVDERGILIKKKKGFYKCSSSAVSGCKDKIKTLMELEYSHTGYYLNYLKECAYSKHKNPHGDDYKPHVKFYFHPFYLVKTPDLKELCNWGKFKKYVQSGSFYIKQIESADGSRDSNSNNVFVVGPSASGKTFSWKTLIPRLPDAYPSNYLSIDGGLMRDYSKVYEMVKEIIRKKNMVRSVGNDDIQNVIDTTKQVSGLSPPRRGKDPSDFIYLKNAPRVFVGGSKTEVIGASSIDIYDIFRGFGLKKEFNLIIENSVKKGGAIISLVIPDTLIGTLKKNALCKMNPNNLLKRTFGECINKNIVDTYRFGRMYGSTSLLHPTVFLVYQHKTPINKVPEGSRCVGTVESGNKRGIVDAKPYSSSAWNTSMILALKLFEAPAVKNGVRFIVHNGGGRGTSTYFNIRSLQSASEIPPNPVINIEELTDIPKLDILSGMLYRGSRSNREYLLLDY